MTDSPSQSASHTTKIMGEGLPGAVGACATLAIVWEVTAVVCVGKGWDQRNLIFGIRQTLGIPEGAFVSGADLGSDCVGRAWFRPSASGEYKANGNGQQTSSFHEVHCVAPIETRINGGTIQEVVTTG